MCKISAEEEREREQALDYATSVAQLVYRWLKKQAEDDDELDAGIDMIFKRNSAGIFFELLRFFLTSSESASKR